MAGEAVFQVSVPGEPGAGDVLGLWQSAPLDATGQAAAATFTDQPAVEGGSLWRAELPGDLDVGDALLGAQARRVAAMSHALPAAGARLRGDLAALPHTGPGGLAFALGQVDPDDPLNILSGALQYRYPDQAESFGLLDFLKPSEREVDGSVDLLDRFTRQVRQAVGSFATVETVIGGRRACRTVAGWSGDIETWWAAGGLPGERRQHEQVLAQALATRQNWLRFLLMVAGGVTRVAGVLAAGPFSPVAIWTTWNYFQQVLKAYRQAAQGPD